jgi:RimJ/RimL family protein N-acetyltransferase
MYNKLGFRQEGILREHSYQFGRYVDKVMFGMLRKEYLKSVLGEASGKE